MSKERGNILFLILLAVILFAALSYAVTQSMRGGGKDSSSENTKAGAGAILQFLSQVDTALMRMRLSQGLASESISFGYLSPRYNSTPTTLWANSNCGSDSCRLFKLDGGGVAPLFFDKYAVTDPTGWVAGWSAPGALDFYMYQWPFAGTSANDVIMRVLALDPAICSEINAALSITGNISAAGTSLSATNPANWDNPAWTCSGSCNQLIDKTTFGSAMAGSGTGAHCYVYHLLIPR